MNISKTSRLFGLRAFTLTLLIFLSFFLSSCELAKNELKIDRSSDMEVQDYRDALAQRNVEVKADEADEAAIPNFKPYMANSVDTLKPMPLVSVSVNQTVPIKDVLYELAEQAGYDLELDPRIQGSIILTSRNRPFDEVVDKICETAGLRYKFTDDSVKIELDTPYHKIYSLNYLSFIRKNSSSIQNDISVVSGEGADTGSSFSAGSESQSDFWGELDANLKQILDGNRNVASLKTDVDPRINATTDSPAPVEPVLLTSDGEIAQGPGGQTVQVAAPDAVLRVEPLPTDAAATTTATEGETDPFAPRYSINKQAGVISVFANDRSHSQIQKYLDAVQKSTTSQVLIEAKVLEVSLKDEFAAGIDWSLIDIFSGQTSIATNSAGNIFGGLANGDLSGLAPAFDTPSLGAFAKYVGADLNLAVQAMQRFGTIRALASPRLTVLNNQSAVLNVSKNQVYFEIDVESSTSDGVTERNVSTDIKTVPVGLLINVQPSIDQDAQTISMSVRPTITKIVEFIENPGTTIAAADAGLADLVSKVPVVNIQEFDSVINVSSGQPIVLGGLMQDSTTSSQNAVPVLGEMPVLGGLFRNQGDKVEKTELVVLLKATIVEGSNTITPTDKDLYRSFSQDRRPFKL